MCPHGGVVQHIPTTQTTFRINGELPMLQTDFYTIAGCPFVIPMPGGAMPSPCYQVMWVTFSQYLFVGGIPALNNVSTGLCNSAAGIPLGPAIIANWQSSYQEPTKITQV